MIFLPLIELLVRIKKFDQNEKETATRGRCIMYQQGQGMSKMPTMIMLQTKKTHPEISQEHRKTTE